MVTPSEYIGSVKDSDISKSCDICMEGKSYGRQHRLHLYIKPGYGQSVIKCFNCGYSTNLYNYLKENHPNEFPLYKQERLGNNFKELQMENLHKKEVEDEIKEVEDEWGVEIPNIITPDTPDTSEASDTPNTIIESSKQSLPGYHTLSLISPIEEFSSLPPEVVSYITSRGIEPKDNWLYAPKNTKIKFNGVNQTLNEYIIIPLTYGDKWYGFQALAWKQKRFFVYMLLGNSGFKVWNWDHINKDEPVYIFESIYDAISSGKPNIIAQLGANLSEERLKELKHPIFCLDNQNVDEKSQEETLKYLEAGYKCFIWPKGSENFKDTNDLRKVKVPYEKISEMIDNNIYEGMEGILKIKLEF